METEIYNWLVLIYYLPPEAGSARVRIWRKMKKLGMVSFRNSVYFLPFSEEHYEITQWLCQEIQKAGGEATLLKTQSVENLTDEEVADFFRKARGEEYGQVALVAEDLHVRLVALGSARGKAGKDVGAAGMIGLVDELKGIEKRLSEIREIDFFGAPGRRQAEETASRCRQDVRRLQKQEEPPDKSAGQRQPRLDHADFQGKTWVTRPRPFVDRIATAWAISRFIDPKARFVFANDHATATGAVPFDYVDADISHQGEDCTFETLVNRFGFKSEAIDDVAEIVHDVDLKDAKFNRLEAAGLETILKGLAATHAGDQELMERGFALFDNLFAGLGMSIATKRPASAQTPKRRSARKQAASGKSTENPASKSNISKRATAHRTTTDS